MQRQALLGLMAPLCILAACKGTGGRASPDPGTGAPQSLAAPTGAPASLAIPTAPGNDEDLAAAMRGDADFAAGLFARLPADRNLVVSPGSLRVALAMASAGARGDTATAMATTLALDPDPPRNHRGFAVALRSFASFAAAAAAPDDLPASGGPPDEKEAGAGEQTLRVVNRLWTQKGYPFAPEFLSLLDASYAAPVTALDFKEQPERSRVAINADVAGATDHRIPELVPPGGVSDLTRLVLTNAVYLKARWAQPFLPEQTREGPFVVSASASVPAKLMTQTRHFAYGSRPDADVLELPFRSPLLSMFIVLPKQKTGLADLERRISARAIASWTKGLRPAEVHVTLPRFSASSALSLKGALAAMGMATAFDPLRANFSGISTASRLYVGDVFHDAFVRVDESGTEAAAASAVVMTEPMSRVIAPAPPVEFRADHPFLFLLVEKKTGSVLFMGRVVEPAR